MDMHEMTALLTGPFGLHAAELMNPENLAGWAWRPGDEDRPDPRLGIGDRFRVTFMKLSEPWGMHTPTEDHYMLLCPRLGTLTVRLHSGTLTLGPGSALLLPPQLPRSYDACAEGDCTVVLSLREKLLRDRHLEDLPSIGQLFDSTAGGVRATGILYRYEQDAAADHYLNQLVCEHLDPDRRTYMTAEALLNLLLIALDRSVEVSSQTHGRSTPHTIGAVHRYIRTNYASVTLETTARRFGFSPNHLSYMLKQATGKSFQELKQAECMENAARLLQDSDMTVTEIAAAVGIRNITQFYRVFQKQFSVTPAAWRRTHREPI